MKKIIVMLAVLPFLIAVPVFAEESQDKDGVSGMAMDKSMGMSMPDMEKKCRTMMGKAQMVATDEGGVIVLAGNKLMKYDAELNLVKEAEIQMPMPPMGGMMGSKQCPMMGKMTDPGTAPAAAEPQEKKA